MKLNTVHILLFSYLFIFGIGVFSFILKVDSNNALIQKQCVQFDVKGDDFSSVVNYIIEENTKEEKDNNQEEKDTSTKEDEVTKNEFFGRFTAHNLAVNTTISVRCTKNKQSSFYLESRYWGYKPNKGTPPPEVMA